MERSSLNSSLKSQYRAGLAMLRAVIDSCPPELWTDTRFTNPTWRVAYHVLFYTDFYLQPSETDFKPWELHRPGYHRLGEAPPDGTALEPYTIPRIREYWEQCDQLVSPAVDRLDLDAPTSGFPWYRMSKLEHQFVNLRHLQHHAGQLAERLRQVTDVGISWVGSGR